MANLQYISDNLPGIFSDLDEALKGMRFSTYEITPQNEWVEQYQKFYNDVYISAWSQIRPLQEKLLKTNI